MTVEATWVKQTSLCISVPKSNCLESKLKISEEDFTPRTRQRSNTLPKSFGSQLEKEEEKKQELVDKTIRPSVEATLECIQRKLQEKRTESSRPEDIKVWCSWRAWGNGPSSASAANTVRTQVVQTGAETFATLTSWSTRFPARRCSPLLSPGITVLSPVKGGKTTRDRAGHTNSFKHKDTF